MALRFVDSFDHYATADITNKWTSLSQGGSATATVSSLAARSGANGLRILMLNGTNTYVGKTLDAQQTWIAGFAIKIATLANDQLFALADAGTVQCDLRLNSDGTLKVTRAGTTLGTTTFAISTGVFYFIEIKIKIDPSTGTVDLKINNDSKLSLSSQNTRNTANSTANQVTFGCFNGIAQSTGTPAAHDYDDIYICDSTGAVNNTFLGDSKDECIFPSATGNYATFTRGGADSGANWSQVDETAPNGDTDYNESGSLTAKDSFNYQNLVATAGTINGVTVNAYLKKTDAGDRRVRFFTRISGTDYFSPVQVISTSYTYYSYTWETSPATSSAWTVSEVNAAEFGYEMNA